MPNERLRRTADIFRILRYPELRALWLADWISDAGSFVTFIALAVFVNELTGSAAAVGVALALRSVPWFTIGPFAGVLADRTDRRRVMIGTDLARAALVAALPFTHAVWQAYALSLASSMFAPIHRPARSALLAQIAPEGRLVPALAVMDTTHNVLHMVGPALGGLIVLVAGARNAFFLDAASFLVAAAFVSTIATRGRRPVSLNASALRELRDGFRIVFRTPVVRTYTLVNSGEYLGFSGVIALLVVYVRDTLDRPGGQYGLLLSVAGLGTVVATLIIAAGDARRSRMPWVVVSAVGMAAFAVSAWRPGFFLLFPIAFAAGFGEGGVGIPVSATLAEALPDDVRGRAYGTAQAVEELAAAVGSLVFAWLGEAGRLGAANGMALAGGVGALLAFLVLATGGARAIRSNESARLAAVARG